MAYLLDSNVFIAAKDQYYGFDFCPAFWNWLIEKHDSGVVRSVEKVGDELMSGNDDLANWAAQRGPEFFRAPVPTDLPALEAVARWVSEYGYEQPAVGTFVRKADYYLIGQARASGHVVVTLENPSSSLRRIKIPNVCIGVGVSVITPFEMLRREKARFVLGSAP